jgi:hypothetical protein
MDRKKWGLGKGNIGKAKSREIERIKEMSGKLRWAWTWSYWDDTEKFNAHVLMEIATPFPWEHDQVAPVDQPINAAGRPIGKLLQEHFNDINPLLLKIVHAHPVSFIFHAVGVKTLDHIPSLGSVDRWSRSQKEFTIDLPTLDASSGQDPQKAAETFEFAQLVAPMCDYVVTTLDQLGPDEAIYATVSIDGLNAKWTRLMVTIIAPETAK